MTAKQAKEYVSNVRWQVARDGTHSYTVKHWHPEFHQEFIQFVLMIQHTGYKKKFGKVDYLYLDVEDFTYWVMPQYSARSVILINRKPI